MGQYRCLSSCQYHDRSINKPSDLRPQKKIKQEAHGPHCHQRKQFKLINTYDYIMR